MGRIDLAGPIPQDVQESWDVLARNPAQVRGWAVVGFTMSLTCIGVAFLAARLWVCLRLQKKLSLSDYLALLGGLGSLAMLAATSYFAKRGGLDHHYYNLDSSQRVYVLQLLFISYVAYIAIVTVIRVSILLFVGRMVDRRIQPLIMYSIWFMLAFNLGFFIVFELSPIVTCRPLPAYWFRADPTWRDNHEFSCINDSLNILLGSVAGVPVDFALAILPIATISGCKLAWRQKFALTGLFSLAFLPSIAAGIRTYYLWLAFYQDWDFSWIAYDILVWSTVEVFFGCVCNNAPAVRTLYRHTRAEQATTPVLKVLRRIVQSISATIPFKERQIQRNTIMDSQDRYERDIHSTMCSYGGRGWQTTTTRSTAHSQISSVVESTASRHSSRDSKIWDKSHKFRLQPCVEEEDLTIMVEAHVTVSEERKTPWEIHQDVCSPDSVELEDYMNSDTKLIT